MEPLENFGKWKLSRHFNAEICMNIPQPQRHFVLEFSAMVQCCKTHFVYVWLDISHNLFRFYSSFSFASIPSISLRLHSRRRRRLFFWRLLVSDSFFSHFVYIFLCFNRFTLFSSHFLHFNCDCWLRLTMLSAIAYNSNALGFVVLSKR